MWRVLGDTGRAGEVLESALTLVREIGCSQLEAGLLLEFSRVAEEDADAEQAWDHAIKALVVAREIGRVAETASALIQIGGSACGMVRMRRLVTRSRKPWTSHASNRWRRTWRGLWLYSRA